MKKASVHLTNREIEVLRLVAQGYGNKQIAKHLKLSIYTIKNHLHNILEKTGTQSREEAARVALQIRPPENPCSCCPVKAVNETQAKLALIAADLRRIASQLEGE